MLYQTCSKTHFLFFSLLSIYRRLLKIPRDISVNPRPTIEINSGISIEGSIELPEVEIEAG